MNWTKVGMVGGVIGTAFVYKWASDSTRKAVVMAQEELAGKRTAEEKYFFEECKGLEDAYNRLMDREENIVATMVAESKTAYKNAKAAADEITDREMTRFNNGKVSLQKELAELTEACGVILKEESARVKDILKEDSSYQMLQEARRVLVEGEKPTDKVDAKLKERMETVQNSIVGMRSDETKTKFRHKDTVGLRLANYDKEMDYIVAGRSQEDKDAMARYKAAADNVLDKKKAYGIVAGNRSDDDIRLIEKFEDAELRKRSILEQEKTSVDPKVALGRYLKATGYSKGEVIAISLVPVIPVACAGVAYAQWVGGIINNMEE